MVDFWKEQLEKSIAKKKVRIKHFEKHGIGINAMKTKADLLKAEKRLSDMK